MSFDIIPTGKFEKELKPLVKKFPSLKNEYLELIDLLEKNPETGSYIGNSCYKIRLSIASKGSGKRGGGRVITCIKIEKEIVYLVSIYDKSDQETISEKDLRERLDAENI